MVKGNNEITVNRTFKSRIFTMLYRDKKELLDLYNAVTGKHYENPEELEINTLKMPFICLCKMMYLSSLTPDFLFTNINLPITRICR